MICPNCRKENKTGNNFCEYCGTKLEQVQQTPPASIPQDIPQAAAVPVPPKKKWVVPAAIVACVLVLAIGLGIAFWPRNAKTPSRNFEEGVYMVLSDEPVYKKINGDPTGENTTALQMVYLTDFKETDNGEIWAKSEKGDWLKVSDLEYQYLMYGTPETGTTEYQDYVPKGSVSAYAVPGGISRPLETLPAKVTVIETYVMDDSSVWGKLDTGGWACIKDNAGTYMEPYKQETAKQETSKPAAPSTSSNSEIVAGFMPGTYVLNYNMNVRKSPDYDAKQVDSLKEGDWVNIVRIKKGSSNNSVWGEISYNGSNRWICIQDNDYDYLYER